MMVQTMLNVRVQVLAALWNLCLEHNAHRTIYVSFLVMFGKRQYCSMYTYDYSFTIHNWFLCNIFVDLHVIGETSNESDKQRGIYNMYCTSISTWTWYSLKNCVNWELSSCQYAMHTYYFFFAQDHERQQTKKWVGGVKIASEIKRIRQMENKIGKHDSIFNAEILMCSSLYVCGCVRFDANG